MISINATLLAQMINFLILLYILNRILFRPILENMKRRRTQIDQMHVHTESLMRQGEEKLLAYNQQLDKAKSEANLRRESVRKEAYARSDEIIAHSKQEDQEISEKIRTDIAAEVLEVQKGLIREAEMLSAYVAQKVLGRELK